MGAKWPKAGLTAHRVIQKLRFLQVSQYRKGKYMATFPAWGSLRLDVSFSLSLGVVQAWRQAWPPEGWTLGSVQKEKCT